jgi:hypothetical protein
LVKIFLDGGTDRGVPYAAGAYYDVFPSHADAVADYRAEPGTGHSGAPNAFPRPARILKASLPNGGIRYEGVEFVDRNVRVFAYVTNTSFNPLPPDARARAVSLGTFALKHLERVRRSS